MTTAVATTVAATATRAFVLIAGSDGSFFKVSHKRGREGA
jgi:hypothetical protein